MERPFLSLILVVACATASPHGFYYQTVTHPGYQQDYQQDYQQPYQRAYQPYQQQVLTLPYPPLHYTAYSGPQYIVPAVIPKTIYSEPSHMAQGYSYETVDNSGGRSQVLYVAGPNSHQLFRENANIMHLLLPTLNLSGSKKPSEGQPPSQTKTAAPAAPAGTVHYIHAQVIPHGKALFGTMPLFAYSYNVIPNKGDMNENSNKTGETAPSTAAPDDSSDLTGTTESSETASSISVTDSSSSSTSSSVSESGLGETPDLSGLGSPDAPELDSGNTSNSNDPSDSSSSSGSSSTTDKSDSSDVSETTDVGPDNESNTEEPTESPVDDETL